MKRESRLLFLAAGFALLAACTGESVRVVLSDRNPANPSAAEAPFVPPSDPFMGETLAPLPPAGKPPGHRHGDHQGPTDDGMRMDDMRMDDDQGSGMMHGGHGMPGPEEKEGEK
ncbi:hypothetical protein [Geobacter sp.]|uniref:hypothetical protein n=1 Tax=Geobacter sp. TaxID=46610 RepID=UPI00260825B9|nr:hypothetical protein [Geobacter sp.]